MIYAYFMPHLNWRTAEERKKEQKAFGAAAILTRHACGAVRKEIADLELKRCDKVPKTRPFHFRPRKEGRKEGRKSREKGS